MHPDFSLVLQKCASNLSLKHKQPFLNKTKHNNKNMSDINTNSPDEQDDLVRIVSDEENDSREPILYNKIANQEREIEPDNLSMCSELSVGKENPEQEPCSSNPMEEDEEEILDISDTHSNSSNDEMSTTTTLVGSQDTNINPFALANTLRFPVPFSLTNTANNNAATATNISPFQEEFLRKSHLYAEELMKHQMQLMAAARVSAFSLRGHNLTPQLATAPHLVNHLHPLAKIGQLSAAAAAAAFSAAAAQQNHKPLNHHNQYNNQNMLQQQNLQFNHQYDTLAKLTEISKQHTATPNHTNSSTQQMMSTLNQLQTQMQAHLPGLLNDNNDNLHERALKFSIDNILKADFGRSNSLDSPPLQRKSSTHKSHNQRHKHNASAPNSSVLTETLEHTVQSLSNQISPTTQTFSSSLATICTNSNDSSSTAVSSNYSSANGAGDLVKSSPSQTPTLSPGFSENGSAVGNNKNSTANSSNKTEESATTTTTTATSTSATGTGSGPIVWPAWVYCTRYSDRPSSGRSPRVRKPKTPKSTNSSVNTAAVTTTNTGGEITNSPSSSSSSANNNNNNNEDKRPRTAFSGSQLARLKHEFNENRYLTEKRRQQLSSELGLNEAQIKIWFQNKRAKLKKSSGVKNPLALQLMAQGLYNHSTIPLTREEEELQEMQEREKNGGTNNNNNSLQQTQQQATGAVSS